MRPRSNEPPRGWVKSAADEVPRLIARCGHDLVKAIEIENMVILAKLMVHASLIREESRGFHFRREFPYTDNENWLKRILLWKGLSGQVLSATEAVDTPFVRPTETRSLPPGAKKPRRGCHAERREPSAMIVFHRRCEVQPLR